MCEVLRDDTIRDAAAADRTAMDRVLREFSPRMQRQLSAYGLDAEESADALQNAHVKIVRGLGSFRHTSRLSTWIFRLTANEALMLLRMKRRSNARHIAGLPLEQLESLPGMQDARQADTALCTARAAARMHRELARLPDTYRAVIVAHYLDELNLDEASKRLGVSSSAVKARLARARKSLRVALAQDETHAAR
jgi:RNA polymerase sigma-70 factor (ECF subfamily)